MFAVAKPEAARQLFAESCGEAPGRGRLAGRRILVVGGGQQDSGDAEQPVGNGRAMCVLFAREGAAIACADKNAASARETVDRIRTEGGTGHDIVADVAKPDEVKRMVGTAGEQLGGLDGLVLNVGIAGEKWLSGQTAEAWDYVFAVNVRAHMLACKAALPVLDAGSSIVLISSLASLRPGTQKPAYDASKAALAGLCRHVAMEGEERGIRANVLAPGLIDTPLGRLASKGRPGRSQQTLPFGRQGTGWEVAYAALFLISHEASYVNAHVLLADGGLGAAQLR